MKKVIIVGSGGHGRAVAEAIALGQELEPIGFIDDAWPLHKFIWNIPVLSDTKNLNKLVYEADYAVVAIGNNKLRETLQNSLIVHGFKLATVIHPRAIISPSAIINEGSMVMAGAIVGTEARVGKGVIINSGANVDHHCTVSDFGHLGVNACMAGGAILGERSWMQAGSALGYGVIINADKIVLPGIGVTK